MIVFSLKLRLDLNIWSFNYSFSYVERWSLSADPKVTTYNIDPSTIYSKISNYVSLITFALVQYNINITTINVRVILTSITYLKTGHSFFFAHREKNEVEAHFKRLFFYIFRLLWLTIFFSVLSNVSFPCFSVTLYQWVPNLRYAYPKGYVINLKGYIKF